MYIFMLCKRLYMIKEKDLETVSLHLILYFISPIIPSLSLFWYKNISNLYLVFCVGFVWTFKGKGKTGNKNCIALASVDLIKGVRKLYNYTRFFTNSTAYELFLRFGLFGS